LYRPCNVQETYFAIRSALNQKDKPSSIVTSRLAFDFANEVDFVDLKKGMYVIKKSDSSNNFDFGIIASGSEVALAIKAAEVLSLKYPNKKWKVISALSTNLFEEQTPAYKDSLLNAKLMFSLEAGSTLP
jgi:transketolase